MGNLLGSSKYSLILILQSLATFASVLTTSNLMMPYVRVSKQNSLTHQEYSEAMMMELESANDRRIQTFNYILIQKNKVAQNYNKRIKRKSFEIGELAWNIILSVGFLATVFSNIQSFSSKVSCYILCFGESRLF